GFPARSSPGRRSKGRGRSPYLYRPPYGTWSTDRHRKRIILLPRHPQAARCLRPASLARGRTPPKRPVAAPAGRTSPCPPRAPRAGSSPESALSIASATAGCLQVPVRDRCPARLRRGTPGTADRKVPFLRRLSETVELQGRRRKRPTRRRQP